MRQILLFMSMLQMRTLRHKLVCDLPKAMQPGALRPTVWLLRPRASLPGRASYFCYGVWTIHTPFFSPLQGYVKHLKLFIALSVLLKVVLQVQQPLKFVTLNFLSWEDMVTWEHEGLDIFLFFFEGQFLPFILPKYLALKICSEHATPCEHKLWDTRVSQIHTNRKLQNRLHSRFYWSGKEGSLLPPCSLCLNYTYF